MSSSSIRVLPLGRNLINVTERDLAAYVHRSTCELCLASAHSFDDEHIIGRAS